MSIKLTFKQILIAKFIAVIRAMYFADVGLS